MTTETAPHRMTKAELIAELGEYAAATDEAAEGYEEHSQKAARRYLQGKAEGLRIAARMADELDEPDGGATALSVEVAEDPQAVALAEVVEELERYAAQNRQVADVREKETTAYDREVAVSNLRGEAQGLEHALALLRRVAPEPTIPSAAVARIVALRDHWALQQTRLEQEMPEHRLSGDVAGLLGQVLSIIAEEAPEPSGEDSAWREAHNARVTNQFAEWCEREADVARPKTTGYNMELVMRTADLCFERMNTLRAIAARLREATTDAPK